MDSLGRNIETKCQHGLSDRCIYCICSTPEREKAFLSGWRPKDRFEEPPKKPIKEG